jgi:choline dehydrogenase
MRGLFTGKGMLEYTPSIVAASVKIVKESAIPDIQFTFAPRSFKGGQIGEFEDRPGLTPGGCDPSPGVMSKANSNRRG